MRHYPYLAVLLLSATHALSDILPIENGSDQGRVLDACRTIASQISSSDDVHYPRKPASSATVSKLTTLSEYSASLAYVEDIHHWSANSTQASVCSVRPRTADDVSEILSIIGDTRVPFAVKGGGHATNQGFSSTPGVHIAMSAFSEVVYHERNQTVEVGAGLIWDQVYAALEPHGVTVLGGRVSGVGVAGFTLGGGYSWKSNQHGLTIDTIVAYELVLPTGDIVAVTESSYPDLFFGLKGIVTKFTFNAYPQTQVFGGFLLYPATSIAAATAATNKFIAKRTDPLAQVLVEYIVTARLLFVAATLFYDAPTAPAGTFDDFLSIPAVTRDVKTRSLLSLVKSTPVPVEGFRSLFNHVSVLDHTPALLDLLHDQALFAENISLNGFVYGFVVEPFLPSYFNNSKGGAYPHDPDHPLMPLHMTFSWKNPAEDQAFIDASKAVAKAIFDLAVSEGQDIDEEKQIQYGNYALADTPLERVYGRNVERLRGIKREYDPGDVMSLAGGFRF
ncbi:hypothetical protein BOTBODRAFT_122239 [Botryobasidium botryosum FD-172 SS1]|uniref:FAD-binding PCMH-type domain-containing protein n=1 Tax=Botryobasidium botryosum (strain FD-172 SS1) TaxID=930990 RepID=A0A067LRK0_BOTB1|nr:hypothetical protein BOTBODRAFT_122239 [Botryobasidium botryosum FD-172 SS1]